MTKPLLPETYLPREVDAFLKSWIDSNESFLLVQGPRQVGKSASVGHALESLTFGDDYGYIDFSDHERAEALYASSSPSKTLVEDLLFSIGATLRDNAILFMDEIQNALPQNIEDTGVQRKWIKNLLSSARDASVRLVLTGSFLGLSLSELSDLFCEEGYPILTVRPLSLHEFSIAKGFFTEPEWEEACNTCCSRKRLSLSQHHKMMDAFACYLYVGGMPASVSKFDSKTGDLSKSEAELKSLLDVSKSVLAQYTDIHGRETFFENMMELFYQGIKASDKETFNRRAFDLKKAEAHTLNFIKRSEVGLLILPLNSNDEAKAKIYFSDVGVMHYLAFHGSHPEYEAKDAQTGLSILRQYYAGASDDKTGNIGYVYEQVVASAFSHQGIVSNYLNDGEHEIEFLYQGSGIEIKSGDYDTRASLKWYVEQGHVGYVLGPHPYVGKYGALNYAPIYWAFFLGERQDLFATDLPFAHGEEKEELRLLLRGEEY